MNKLEEQSYLVETQGRIFIFFQQKLLVYDLNTKVQRQIDGYVEDKELKKVLVYNYSQVTMFYIAHGFGGFSAYILQDNNQFEKMSLNKLYNSVKENVSFNIVDINFYDYQVLLGGVKTVFLNIYALDQNSGIYLFQQIFQDEIVLPSEIYQIKKVFIEQKNGQIFNMYKQETFIVVGSQYGNFIATEIEFNLQNNEYFINRQHEVSYDIQDILINENYAILCGANTHTIVWHSINSKVIQDIQPYQAYFNIFGYNGGAFFKGAYNETVGKSVDFFAGLQRRHIFVVKIIEDDPYFTCDATDSKIKNLIGDHNLFLQANKNCPTQKQPNSNQYCIDKLKLTLSVQNVYADSENALDITVFFFCCIALLLLIGVTIYRLYKRKYARKTNLLLEFTNFKNQQKALNIQNYEQL
ncbi:hypothetical protein IMG5_193870, partial [Ichthyophthirius multifiliis]